MKNELFIYKSNLSTMFATQQFDYADLNAENFYSGRLSHRMV